MAIVSSLWQRASLRLQTIYAFLKIALCRLGILGNKSLPWYNSKPFETCLTPTVQNWLAGYIGLEEDQVLPHLINIHERAWRIRPYPCVGQFAFLRSQLKLLPEYPEILAKLQEPCAIFVDIGVCLGQDIRSLISEGIPSQNLYGLDVVPEFWDLSYDLFKDRDKIDSKFLLVDLLSTDHVAQLDNLYGKSDVIHATNFFHLFDKSTQEIAIQQLVRLSRKGTIVAGLHVGQSEPGVVQMSDGPRLLHNPQSWQQFWTETTEATGTSWQIHASWREWEGYEKQTYAWMGAGRRRLKWFAVRKS